MDEVGVVFGSLTPAELVADGARLAERLGFSDLWFSEDCFFAGGISGMTQVLAATERTTVGLGLASVMTRHPAVLAMELAAIARMYPGRSRATIGLGNTHWLGQLGLVPDKPLTAVEQTYAAVRDLLAGEIVDRRDEVHHYDGVRLDFPPAEPPELWIGAVNERALRTAGRIADGVLLSVLAGPSYVRWVREVLGPRVPITAFVLASVDDDERRARDAVRDAVGFFLRAESHTALVTRSEHADEVREALGSGAEGVPDGWVDEYAAAGSPDTVAERLRALRRAGATSIGLWVFPPERFAEQLTRLAKVVTEV